MFVYHIVIFAANPSKPFSFTKKEDDVKKKLFKDTANACNSSANFKRTGKTIEITKFESNCLTVELQSKAPLENPTLALRGFSRALVRTGNFAENIYRSSLFNAREIELKECKYIDDISVVQKVVALFMSPSDTNTEVKNKIRQIIMEL